MAELSFDECRELFDYNRVTGDLSWVNYSAGKRRDRRVASMSKDGYLNVRVCNKTYKAHRVAYLWFYGRWPDGEIDHINGIKNDNRIDNFRDVTHRENGLNQMLSVSNTSGVNGVYFCKSRKAKSKWLAKIMVRGKWVHCGYHETIEKATEARALADVKYCFHENHGNIRLN